MEAGFREAKSAMGLMVNQRRVCAGMKIKWKRNVGIEILLSLPPYAVSRPAESPTVPVTDAAADHPVKREEGTLYPDLSHLS